MSGTRLAAVDASAETLRTLAAERAAATAQSLPAADPAALTASFQELIQRFGTTRAPAKPFNEAPYLVTNETPDAYLDLLASPEYPRFTGDAPTLMIGIAGQLNFDAAAILRPTFLFLMDINPRLIRYFEEMEKMFRAAPEISAGDFKQAMRRLMQEGVDGNPNYFLGDDGGKSYMPRIQRWFDNPRSWINDNAKFEAIKKCFSKSESPTQSWIITTPRFSGKRLNGCNKTTFCLKCTTPPTR